jgi:amino acid adenylation domain-containing protein
MRAGSLCLHEIFEQRVAEAPDRPAVSYEGETLSYGELNRRANRLAHFLRARDVGPGQLVGLCLDRSLDTVTAILAVLKAGAAYVPMDPSNPAERVRMIVEDAQCPVVVVHEEQRIRFSDSDTLIVLNGTEQSWEAYPEANPESLAICDDLAYVIYTSGSTGRPKGVPIAHRNVTRLFASTACWFDFSNKDAWTLFHSFAFDFSVWELWGALLHGGRLVVVPYWVSRSPEDFHRLLRDEEVTVLNQTPSAFYQLEAHNTSLPIEESKRLALRYVIFGGEALSFPSLKSWFERHGDDRPQIINMYGITETTIHVTYRRVRQHEAVPGTPSYIGVPITDQPCHVVNGDGLLAETGEEGELYVGGAGNASGYMNRPELTAERFVPSPFPEDNGAILYKSGDLVRYLEGDLVYLGRIDRQVQLRGFRVELGEIESALVSFDGVQGAAVRPHISGQSDLRLVAYYNSQSELSVSALREHMARSLPEYMVPSGFMRIHTMPLTGNGKTDYGALPEPILERESAEFIAPRNDIENKLATLWQELLQIPKVGVEDNFFALGGHSLLATQLQVRVRETFQFNLPLRRIMESPTIAAVGRIIEVSKAPDTTEHESFVLTRQHRRGAPLPLSFAQEGLWIANRLSPVHDPYIIPILFKVTGKVDLIRLRAALDAVVARHEVLRTVLRERAGTLVQEVQPVLGASFQVECVTGKDPIDARAREALSRASRTPMKLDTGPLIRFVFYAHESERNFLGVIVHHTVFDGWSISVLLNDLATAYTHRENGRDGSLPQLEYRYVDYSIWQRARYDSGALVSQMEYWKRQLASPLQILELPTDFPRPPRQSWQGAVARCRVDSSTKFALEELALEHRKTLFTVLVAAWQLLLNRYSSQEDILVGSVIAGRNYSGSEEMIGFFANTIVLRTTVINESTFPEFLRSVEEAVLGGLEHREIPFDRLVAELQQERDPSRHPVFQVMIVLQNTPEYEVAFCGLHLSGEEVSNGCAKFDLNLVIQPDPSGLQFNLEYNTSLYRPETAARIVRGYETLLKSILQNPGARLGEFQIVEGPERALLLETWTDTSFALDRSQSLHELFEARVAAHPDAIAVADDEVSLTFSELDAQANQLAHFLLARGVSLEEPVPFFLGRTVRVLVAIIGILKAGAAYVPLDLLDPPGRRARVLSVLTPRLILTEGELAPQLSDTSMECVCLDEAGLLEGFSTGCPGIGASGENLAYVIFTSGSTGDPKGVCCTHQGVINLYQDLQSRLPIGAGDACSIWTAFSFDVSVYESWTSLLAGATLHIIPERVRANPEACLQWLRAREVVTGYIPGFMLPTLLEAQRRAPLPWRRLLVGVEPLSEALLSDIVEATPGLVLLNLYGPTEAAIYVTLYQAHDTHPRPTGNAPIGTAIQNTRIYILDPSMNPLPVGVPGELYIGGVGLARGYYQAPELTARQFVPDPFTELDSKRLYRTGDLVYFKDDGNIQFVRRMDRYIKLRGYRIEPGEIESVLREFPDIDDAVVLLNENGPLGPRLVAYLATGAGDAIVGDALADFLKARLPAHMCPAQFVPLARFPRTVQGKLDRKALPEPSLLKADEEESGPRNECEKHILEIWRSSLETVSRSVHTDFFVLGGHSLLAVKMLDRINRHLGGALTLSDFFDNPTIAGLAEKLGAGTDRLVPPRGIQLREVKPGHRIPFFCLPGAGDSGGIYDAYAEALSADQPFFGFANLDSEESGPAGIEQVARRCIEEMKKVRPSGPYYLGGFSLGGTLAYEMARQLIEAGEEVPFIAIIDGATPDHFLARSMLSKLYLQCLLERSRARCRVFARTWKLHAGYLRDGIGLFLGRAGQRRNSDHPPLRLAEYLRWIWVDASVQYYFIQAGLSAPTLGERRVDLFLDQIVRSRTKTMRSSRQAIGDYRMVPISAEVTLFRAQHNPYKSERRDPTYGWGRYALKGLRVVEVPGNHMAMIRPPYATGLGQALQRIMDELESRRTAL